jgi:hypothetical protein
VYRFDEYWIGPAQLALTATLARTTTDLPGEVVEVGTWQGLSAIPIARAVAPDVLHVVDHWQGDAPDAGDRGIQKHLVARDNYSIFLGNLREAQVTNVEVHKMGWQEFAATLDRQLRFVHIDASHTADEVEGNIRAFLPFAVGGAVFCGDDYGFPEVSEGVRRVFDEVNSSESKFWWKIIGSDAPCAVYPAHGHPLTRTRTYMSILAQAREQFLVANPRECTDKLANSGSSGTY